MHNTSSISRQNQADRIIDSLKAKNSKYHLFATKKIKKNSKKNFKTDLKGSDESSTIPLNNINNANSVINELPWFKDDNGKTKYVTFAMKAPLQNQEKSYLFSDMIKKIITEKYKPKVETKNVYSMCVADKDLEIVYLANSYPEDNKFIIGKLNPPMVPQTKNQRNLEAELENLFIQNQINFLFN